MANPTDEQILQRLEEIVQRLGIKGPIARGIDDVNTGIANGNALLAYLAQIDAKTEQVRLLLVDIKNLLTPEQAVDLGLSGGKVVDKSEPAP